MDEILCPNCRSLIDTVRPKRLKVEMDRGQWKGDLPEAIGLACPQCDVLLPLTAMPTRKD